MKITVLELERDLWGVIEEKALGKMGIAYLPPF